MSSLYIIPSSPAWIAMCIVLMVIGTSLLTLIYLAFYRNKSRSSNSTRFGSMAFGLTSCLGCAYIGVVISFILLCIIPLKSPDEVCSSYNLCNCNDTKSCSKYHVQYGDRCCSKCSDAICCKLDARDDECLGVYTDSDMLEMTLTFTPWSPVLVIIMILFLPTTCVIGLLSAEEYRRSLRP